MRRALLPLLALGAGCADQVTVTVVTVAARPAVHGVESLAVTLGNDNATLDQSFDVHGKSFPLTFSVETPGRTGALTVAVDALDSNGAVVAVGATSATISTNDRTDAAVRLDPADFLVNTSVAGAQKLAWDSTAAGFQLAARDNGEFTVGWSDDCGSLGRCDVWGRRYDAQAIAQTTDIGADDQEFNLNRSNVFGNDPSLSMSSDGTMVVAWTTFDQILVTTITPSGGAGEQVETVASTGTMTGTPAVAALGDGTFLIVWVENDASIPSLREVQGRYLDAAAAPLGPAFRIDNGNGAPAVPAIAATGNGRQYGVAWTDGSRVRVRFSDSGGNLLGGSPVDAVSYPTDLVWSPRLIVNPDGHYLLAWGHDAGTGDPQIVARTITQPDATPVGGDAVLAHGLADTFTGFGITRKDSEYAVAWEGCSGSGDGDGCGILGRAFRATGVPVGDPVVLDTTTAGDQTGPSIIGLGSGAFAAAWTDASGVAPDTSSTGVRARIVYPLFDDARGVLGADCSSTACGTGLVCTAGSDGAKRCYEECGTCPDGGTCNADGGCAF